MQISNLRGKTLAIDIMPILYKYLYSYTKDNGLMRASNGNLTGHLLGTLLYLKNLRKIGINPVICLDHNTPNLKKDTVQSRIQAKKRGLEKLDFLLNNGIELNSKQKKSYQNYTHGIGPEQKSNFIQLIRYLGFPYYLSDEIEAEKACVYLKKIGLVDQVLSDDRDVLLYGHSFLSKLDPKKGTCKYYDLNQVLDRFNLNFNDLRLCCIATGTDYHKGIPLLGPKTVFKKFHQNKDEFRDFVKKNISNYEKIIQYLTEQISFSSYSLIKEEPDPVAFVTKLKQLNFNEKTILSMSGYFFDK